jgi:hypothetical protein
MKGQSAVSKFKVELEVLKRHLAETDQRLLKEAVSDGTQDEPGFLHFRRILRVLQQSIDRLHEGPAV